MLVRASMAYRKARVLRLPIACALFRLCGINSKLNDMEDFGKTCYDVVVVGAGIAGAAVARELARYRLRVCVIEAGVRKKVCRSNVR